MAILVALLTFVLIFLYSQITHEVVYGGHYVWYVILFAAPFIWARYVSTDWEKEQDAANFRAWKQKWRCRLSRLRPARGEIIGPDQTALDADQGDVRKLPKSS